MFEFPLLLGFFAATQEGRTRFRRLFRSAGILGAGAGGFAEVVSFAPQTGAGQKAVFEAGANHLLQVVVPELVGLRGANVFRGQVDARDAFVVGRKGHGHVRFAIQRKGVRFAAHAQNQVVA